MSRRVSFFLLIVMFAATAFAQSANQAAQDQPIVLGTSGGNVNDITHAFCCSGTLGSLVTKNGVGYILSNAHVLARVGQAQPGEDISQPGLVDYSCGVFQVVADYSEMAPLNGSAGSNVDAALAEVRSGAVTATGEIIGVGVPAGTTATPTVGRGVAKSGRTTGLTCASIGSVSTTVSVRYQKNCGSGRKFLITYANQVVINGSGFSAGGDSGSLIVTSDSAQPVGLLYAGNSTSTIANPIGDVVAALGVSFVGGNTHSVTCPSPAAAIGRTPSQAALDHALAVKEAHVDQLMSTPAVQGVGVGADENGDAVIVVYTELGRAEGPIPAMIDGVRTRVVRTDEFRAF